MEDSNFGRGSAGFC